jgi:anti-sigma B factor antagonist
MLFRMNVQRANGVARVSLEGEMDMAAVDPFLRGLSEVEQEPGVEILVDLRGLTFLDSSGLHQLVELHERSLTAGRTVELVGTPDKLTKLFELTSLGYLITRQDDSRLLRQFDRAEFAD